MVLIDRFSAKTALLRDSTKWLEFGGRVLISDYKKIGDLANYLRINEKGSNEGGADL